MSDELVNSAVTFLQDPKVADAPLAKRIAFLESKGLSSEQVQVALQRAQDPSAASSSPNVASTAPSRPTSHYAPYETRQMTVPPPLPQRDWRDWFIMAIVSGGFSWAIYFLAKRYVLPLMNPPTPTQLESDKADITAQFDQVQEMLAILQRDTESTKQAAEGQTKKVETALVSVDAAVEEMKSKTERRENDIRRIGLEMLQLREMIPKAIDQVKAAQNDALADLNGELRSLKTLLQNRIKATSGGGGPAVPATSNVVSNGAAKTGSAGGSVAQVAQAQAQQSGSGTATSKTTVSDPLARFTSRSAGIPEWQKSVPAAKETGVGENGAAAGSVEATASNVENTGGSA